MKNSSPLEDRQTDSLTIATPQGLMVTPRAVNLGTVLGKVSEMARRAGSEQRISGRIQSRGKEMIYTSSLWGQIPDKSPIHTQAPREKVRMDHKKARRVPTSISSRSHRRALGFLSAGQCSLSLGNQIVALLWNEGAGSQKKS